jgi:excisionase family DNA binding protein
MSPAEAATATGVNKLTILKWIRAGRLPAEKIMTPHGPGYDIRPEDLTQALQRPRKKAERAPQPVRGSMLEELQAMRELLEQQVAESARREEAIRAELNDLRGQFAQTEQRLQETLRALPARRPERRGLFSRWGRKEVDR